MIRDPGRDLMLPKAAWNSRQEVFVRKFDLVGKILVDPENPLPTVFCVYLSHSTCRE